MLLCAKKIITGDGVTVITDGAVLVNAKGKIEKVGKAADLKAAYPQENVKDYGNATIMPGLFDMHIHLGYWFSQPDREKYQNDFLVAYYALQHAQSAFTRGITTVRDMSSPATLCHNLRLAQEKGFLTVPRIIHADCGICMTGGHGSGDGIAEIDGPWNIRSEIRHQMRAGADWIKILTSHRSDIPEFTQEELDAAVDECHRRRIKCAVHAGTQPAIEMCINAGFDTIEHGTFMTVEQAEKMAEKGLAWTPTITAYTYLYEVTKRNLEEGIDTSDNPIAEKEMRDYHYYEPAARSYRENFKKLADTGVTVLAGSDMVLLGAPVCPIPEELGYMVQYGFNSLQAIQAATSNPAKVLGIQDEVGELKEGLAADILVVDGDTEEDITTLMKINTVYQAGRVVYADNELKVK